MAKQSRKVLLMVSHAKVFKALEAALEEVGCQMTDDFDADLNVDLVVMDSFYLNAGMADYMKMETAGVSTLLVLFPNEGLELQGQYAGKIDDVIVLGPHQGYEDLFFLAMDWLKNAWRFSTSKVLSKEFGAGLWASLMFRLATLN